METKTIRAGDITAQLKRLHNIATHNLAEAQTPGERAYERGQINALRAVALSYGLSHPPRTPEMTIRGS